MTLPRARPASTNGTPVEGGIPQILYQTFITPQVTPQMKSQVESWWEKNPSYSYRFFTDKECQQMITQHLGDRVGAAYHKLIPGAFRADLWRYCVLYLFGGVYMDIPMRCVTPLRDVFQPGVDLVVVKDSPSQPYYLYNAFMAALPGHPVLKRAIEMCVEHIENKWYGSLEESICVTGPGVLGRALNEVLSRPDKTPFSLGVLRESDLQVQILDHQPGRVICDGRVVCQTKYPGYTEDRATFAGHHYWKYYSSGQVYREEIPLRVEARVRPQVEQMIPRYIYQTFETQGVTPNMYKATESWRRLNPDYTYLFLDDTQRQHFLEKYFSERVVKAYRKLIPGAFRADLWRYCMLYEYGGVYTDIDTTCLVGLGKVIGPQDTCVVCVDGDKTRNLHNAFIACVPKHPLLLRAYETVVRHTEEGYYGSSDTDVSGPRVLGEALHFLLQQGEKVEFQEGHLSQGELQVKILQHNVWKHTITSGGQSLVSTKYDGYDGERLSLGGDDWSEAWANRNIYR